MFYELNSALAERLSMTQSNCCRLIGFLLVASLVLGCVPQLESKRSLAVSEYWREFSEGDAASRHLPDYSYAGFQYGTAPIPDVAGPVFDVTDYGAVADDGRSDFSAISQAVAAANDNRGGVVFFPPGRYLVNEDPNRMRGFHVKSSNVVIRGSGSGVGGTELFMRYPLNQYDATRLWAVAPMFLFLKPSVDTGVWSYEPSTPPVHALDENAVVAGIAADSHRGAFTVKVDQPELFSPGQSVSLVLQSTKLNDAHLAGLTPHSSWHRLLEQGVKVNERHTVKNVSGNELTFNEPLRVAIDSSLGWRVILTPQSSGWGFEDLVFRGNFQETFDHHKNWIHDAGWRAVTMYDARDSWVRRVLFIDVNAGINFAGMNGSSVLSTTFAGNAGHITFLSSRGYGNLFGLARDITNDGVWHGPGANDANVGQVVWRYEGHDALEFESQFADKVRQEIANHEGAKEYYQWANRAGPDFHAEFPHTSLWDASTSRLSGHGGGHASLPNHLGDLTFWNLRQLGQAVDDVDFWRVVDDPDLLYGSTFIVRPNVIGFHGANTTFKLENLGAVESLGSPVFPFSLYEAQLELRMGHRPAWLDAAIADWKNTKRQHDRYLESSLHGG